MQNYIIFTYIALITLFAVSFTIVDKIKAKKNLWRISEKTLMLIGLLGGALPMYITMKIIHHKTKKRLFMIGLPIEMFLQFVLIFIYAFFLLN